MPNDGIAAPPIPVIKSDQDDEKTDRVMDEEDPDGDKPMDIDEAVLQTDHIDHPPKDDLLTVPVDHRVQHEEKSLENEEDL